MSHLQRKNGTLEIRFNEDRTRATATIHPPSLGGEAVEVSDVLKRLKAMGVMYGIREQAVLEAIHYVKDNDKLIANVLIAQGTTPQDGIDARVRYHLPVELLSKVLPKNASGQTDWFTLDPAKLVKAEQELATIIPALAGVPGKTLSMPIQTIAPKPGKPANLTAGQNVRLANEGTRLLACTDGYACLHNESMTVHALQRFDESVTGGLYEFPHGVIYMEGLTQTDVRAGGFIAVKGAIRNCFLRAHGDITVRAARDSTIIATGSVYVQEGLTNCIVITPNKIIAMPHTQITGSSLCAKEGIDAGSLGSSEYTPMEIVVGEDRYSSVRNEEIGEELAACEVNRERINQALKPFTSLTAHTQLTDDKRLLLQKMQEQKRAFEERSKELHSERRALLIAAKCHLGVRINAARTVHPGVWLQIGTAAMQMEVPMENVAFVAASNGKAVEVQSLAVAA